MRSAALGALVAIVVVALAGCGSAPPSSKIASSTLTVYTSLPMRGDRAAQSREILRGEKLALRDAGGRVGERRIGIVALDDTEEGGDEWSPGQAATNARDAAQNLSTVAYIGDLDSGATAISLPITNEAGILHVSPLSGYTGLTHRSDKGEPEKYYPSGERTFARLVPNGIVEARALAEWLRRLGIDRVAIAADDHQDGQGTVRDLTRELAPRRVQVVDDVRVGRHVDDVTDPVEELAERKPGAVIYAGSSPSAAARLLRMARLALPGTPLFATSAASAHGEFIRLLGPAASAIRVTSPLLPVGDDARTQRVVEGYRRAFGSAPTPAALYGYEAMRSVLQAVRDAGARGNDREAVIAAYRSGRPRNSVIGRYAIDRWGDTTLGTYGGYRVVDGKLRLERRLDGGADSS